MAHQALARKYRPRRFTDVATQSHVSETLRRSVATGRVAHAYLFCGPRGVGKTTLARVLAMALNCADRDPEGEPCGVCDSCTRIWGGHTALDVIEIDAASNRGVDDARDLRERAMYAPSEAGRYKIYIVDEAHMLTREAWNALLKILEEPPPRVIFVFATTEPQKIQQAAAPILSRCQRFDFRRIGVDDIVERLADVLASEGAEGPREALRLIARKADGGMRDGLSLLDQVLSLSGAEVTVDAVRQVLGLVDEERYVDLLDILRAGRAGEVFGFVDGLLDEGYDLVEFYHGLVEVLRALLRMRLPGGDEAPDVRGHVREAYAERAAAFDPSDLVRMLSLSSELESTGSLKRSEQPRLLLEMLLLRLAYLDRTVSLEELIEGLGGASRGPAAGEGGAPEPPASVERERTRGLSDEGAAPPGMEVASGADPRDAVEGTSTATADVGEAWQAVLGGGGLPRGMSVPLRAAAVTEPTPGAVRLSLPPGPALERLQAEPATQRAVADALGEALGRKVSLAVAEATPGATGGAPARATADAVREGRLRELVQQEPALGRAVEELDLELLD